MSYRTISQLLQMLEWHAKARRGGSLDTWYEGRFLSDWAEPQFLAELPLIFAPFEKDATKRALMACMSLMNRLGRETAKLWGYPYPIPNQIEIQDWITAALTVG